MKRDPELVREILLFFERRESSGVIRSQEIEIPQFESGAIRYHVIIMCEGGLLASERIESKTTPDRLIDALPFRLTWEGHDFLDAVRSPTIMSKVMERAKPLGGIPFNVMKAVAVAYVKDAVGLG